MFWRCWDVNNKADLADFLGEKCNKNRFDVRKIKNENKCFFSYFVEKLIFGIVKRARFSPADIIILLYLLLLHLLVLQLTLL